MNTKYLQLKCNILKLLRVKQQATAEQKSVYEKAHARFFEVSILISQN